MNGEDVQFIPVDQIDVGDRLRMIDADWAAFIAHSMADPAVGQLTPIEVRPRPDGRFELTAGGHRLAAVKLNGWPLIQAVIIEADDLTAELRQIDENLVRRELSPFDRATFLARRQELYLLLHPETTQGGTGAAVRWLASDKLSFASDVASKLGVSERDIRRSIARFTKIAPDVREKIAGTWIADHGVSLDALARQTPSDQRKAITLMLRAENPVRSVALALRQINGSADPVPDVDAEQLGKLQDAWRRAGSGAKRLFVEWLVEKAELTPAMVSAIEARLSAEAG